ncbi:PAS domain S-box protein [Geomonas sp. Red32]|uniref:PAS domain-containing sensor histidine kinase n=1 Tax=Geomonas sp. Red32 TaxID=2912856 RepID=UPI00202CF768|nr:PAS domain S-box protein [Geomonas sp. Red32]MCM0081509.1 PAS domain S-box protein [Geomonas sp. Red32]
MKGRAKSRRGGSPKGRYGAARRKVYLRPATLPAPQREWEKMPYSDSDAKAYLAAIVDYSADAIISKNLSGTITSWNRGAHQLYGYSAEEAIGRSISILVPADRLDELAWISERVTRGERVDGLETVRLAKDGRRIDVSLTLSPILRRNGSIRGISIIARDIGARVRAERALRESEKRYRTLVEMAPDAILVHKDGSIVYANCAALGISGAQSLDELRARASILDLIHPDDRDEVRTRLQDLLDGEEIPLREYRLQRLDGTAISVELASTVIDYQGTASIQSIARDVSQRKRQEEARERMLKALSFERARFEAVVCQMPVGVMIAEAPSGKIMYDNLRSREILSVDAGQVNGVADYLRYQLRGLDRSLLPLERYPMVRALKGEEVREEEVEIELGDGTFAYLIVNAAPIRDSAGNISAALAAFMDITMRRKADLALQSSEERLNVAVETAGLGIFHWDFTTDVLDWSPLAKEHYGLPAAREITPPLLRQACHPEDWDHFSRALQEALAPQNGNFAAEYRTVGIADGKLRWLTSRGKVTFDQDGNPLQITGACLDITHIVEAEKALKDEIAERLRTVEELRKQEQLLIRQGRLAAMGEMIGNIAHQWRQPLNTLGLIVQELPRMYAHELFSQEYLEASVAKAMQVINYMSKTIDGFRNFFGQDKEKEYFRACDVLTRTVSIVEAAFTELNMRIEMEMDQVVEVYGYPNEFSQVILNILVNAKDAILERKVPDPKVTLHLSKEDGRAVITITDNGGGIPPDLIDKIFDPYFTTKAPDKGTGIGLFMSKTIIEKNMGGSLTVRNTADGAEFRIEV